MKKLRFLLSAADPSGKNSVTILAHDRCIVVLGLAGWKNVKADVIEQFYLKSVVVISGLHRYMGRIAVIWIAVMTVACTLRVGLSTAAFDIGWPTLISVLPYILIILVPVATLNLALKAFPADGLLAQPRIRLARYGKWRELNCLDACKHQFFGATGMMASLVLGMLINVPFRSVEFLIGIPALGSHPPDWFITLFTLMAADLIVMNSLYIFAFVMAIRHVPWFPRALLLVWGIDLCSQLAIAQLVATNTQLPDTVASALSALLTGNVQKVLISLTVWLPYLLLSDRVNMTYRRRVRVV